MNKNENLHILLSQQSVLPTQVIEMVQYLCSVAVDMYSMYLTQRMYLYAEKFSLKALWNFFQWAQEQELSKFIILETIMHDLNHFNDNFFEPRTSPYENL